MKILSNVTWLLIFLLRICSLRILTEKKRPNIKRQRLRKIRNKFSKKIKQLLAKLCSFWFHFVVAILFVLTLASERAVLNGNDVFSILVVSAKKLTSVS